MGRECWRKRRRQRMERGNLTMSEKGGGEEKRDKEKESEFLTTIAMV